jgi:Gpi18-like mannosyltransferase
MPNAETRAQNGLTREMHPPTLTEVMGIAVVSYIVFLAFLHFAGGSYWSLVGGGFGDNPDYLQSAAAIRHWHISGIHVKQFWGLSYAVAGVSLFTGVSDSAALATVCITTSLMSVAFCYWLWGGWIAAFFALMSLDWFQRSLLGGAEPLFMSLLLASFLVLRQDRWVWATIMASLATVVRPFGVFALFGLGIHLLRLKRYRDCAIATIVGLSIGALYAWPLEHYLGNPFANVDSYQTNDWHGGFPFNFPFVAIIRNTFPIDSPLTNLALTFGWIFFVLLGIVIALRSGEFQRYAKEHTAEACFVLVYWLALYTYNASGWSRSNFPRFALPTLPWILFFLRRSLPRNRKVVWALAVITPCLAAASAVGIRQAGVFLLQRLH